MRTRTVPTMLFLSNPRACLDLDIPWRWFNLVDWSERCYQWEGDPLAGFVDLVQPPRTTLAQGTGDCVDYARVVASYLVATGAEEVTLVACLRRWRPWRGHLIVFDGERVYSSGQITRETPADFLERTPYDSLVRRSVV